MLLLFLGFVSLLSSLLSIYTPDGLSFRKHQKFKEPFLKEESLISDFFGGEVYDAFEEASVHTDAFVFFYAPWDVDCINARDELEIVAEIFSETDLYFAAVECWNPNGDCYFLFNKGKINKIQYFPIFVYYPKNRNGIQYNGPVTAKAIMEFLARARSPLTHIQSKEDLSDLRARFGGTVLVGYFNDLFRDLSLNYRHFLKAAYTFVESDPLNENIGLGVVTSKSLGNLLHLNPSQPVRLFTWNGSYAYPNKTLDHLTIYKWTRSKLKFNGGLTTLLRISGKKSLGLSSRLQQGSGVSLIVFLNDLKSGLSLVREVALLYKSSRNGSKNDLLDRFLPLRLDLEAESLINECYSNPWFLKSFPGAAQCGRNISTPINTIAYPFRRVFRRRKPRLGAPIKDDRIEEMLIQNFRTRCRILVSEQCKSLEKSISLKAPLNSDLAEELFQLEDHDNKTLNFYVMDSDILAENLRLQDSSAVIVDVHKEYQISMTSELSADNLAKFILAYHQKELKHYRRSKILSKQSNKKIQEINSENFQEAVMKPKEHVVLLSVTGSCNHCTAAAHVFQRTQRFLESIPEVTFVRLDASLNDLPWEMTALSYPSIVIFPASDKSNSRVFPSDSKELNFPNLLSFVVANLPLDLRLKLSEALSHDLKLSEKPNLSANYIQNHLHDEF